MATLLRIALPLIILALGWFGYSRLSVEPEQEKRAPREAKPLRSAVVELNRTDYQTIVRTQGVVRAESDAVLTPEVAGKVVEISSSLQDGAFFSNNEVLVRLAEPDFEAAIVRSEADLARAEAAHAQEETKAKQARLNWEDLGYKEEPNELVLRLPQLREAEANVLAAKATLAAAQRDLERAAIRAPFAGRVLRRTVALGQAVGPSTVLAEVFDTSVVEVRLPIAPRDLALLDLPESSADKPVEITLRDSLTPESEAVWKGKIIGTGGALDPDSRELFAIARVEDPLGRKSDSPGTPLRIGQPVVAEIPAQVMEDVLVIPRAAIRELNQIHLIDPDELTLSRAEITPIWGNEELVLIRHDEIADGTLLSTSRLVYAPEGSKVEIITPEELQKEAEAEEIISSAPPHSHRRKKSAKL